MERFVRGDRSRSTEGSGLGLSISKSLTELMNGKFLIEVTGEMFKVILKFPLIKKNTEGQNDGCDHALRDLVDHHFKSRGDFNI